MEHDWVFLTDSAVCHCHRTCRTDVHVQMELINRNTYTNKPTHKQCSGDFIAVWLCKRPWFTQHAVAVLTAKLTWSVSWALL